MSPTPPQILQLARQGHPEAIAALINQHLESQGITAYVTQQENLLQVVLEAAQIPPQHDLVTYVKTGITGLALPTVNHLSVSGKTHDSEVIAWTETLPMGERIVPPAPPPSTADLDTLDLDGPFLEELDLESVLTLPDAGVTDERSMAQNGFDLDLDLDATHQNPLDLDFVTELTSPETNLDLGVEATPYDSDLGLAFDLASIAEEEDFYLRPSGTESSPDEEDLGLDLDLEAMMESEDFDLGTLAEESVTDPGDLGLNFSEELVVDEHDSEFYFDIEPVDISEEGSDQLDHLGLENTPNEEDLGLDLDVIIEAANFDLADLSVEPMAEEDAFNFSDSGPEPPPEAHDIGLESGPKAMSFDLEEDPWGGGKTGVNSSLGIDEIAQDTGVLDNWDTTIREEDVLPLDWDSQPEIVSPFDTVSDSLDLTAEVRSEPGWETELGLADLAEEDTQSPFAFTPLETEKEEFSHVSPFEAASSFEEEGLSDHSPLEEANLEDKILSENFAFDTFESTPSFEEEGFSTLSPLEEANLEGEVIGEDFNFDTFEAASGFEEEGLSDHSPLEEAALGAVEPPFWEPSEDAPGGLDTLTPDAIGFTPDAIGFDLGFASSPDFSADRDIELTFEVTPDEAGGFDPNLGLEPEPDILTTPPVIDETVLPTPDAAAGSEDFIEAAYPEVNVDLGLTDSLSDAAEFEDMDNWADLSEEVPQDDVYVPRVGAVDDGGFPTEEVDAMTWEEGEAEFQGLEDDLDAGESWSTEEPPMAETLPTPLDVATPPPAMGFATPGQPTAEDFDALDWHGEDLASLTNSASGLDFPSNGNNGFHQEASPMTDDIDATDDFIHKFAPGSLEDDDEDTADLEKAAGSPLKLILGVGVGIIALLAVVFGAALLFSPSRQGGAPVAEPPTEAPTEAPIPVSATPFRDAVNAATQASELAQTASTKEEWQAVADSWQTAISLMQQVPDTDPNYATAKDRAVAYQPNLTYAQQNVQRFP